MGALALRQQVDTRVNGADERAHADPEHAVQADQGAAASCECNAAL